eukprot:1342745-Pyramimonas_sp.AAC.1
MQASCPLRAASFSALNPCSSTGSSAAPDVRPTMSALRRLGASGLQGFRDWGPAPPLSTNQRPFGC